MRWLLVGICLIGAAACQNQPPAPTPPPDRATAAPSPTLTLPASLTPGITPSMTPARATSTPPPTYTPAPALPTLTALPPTLTPPPTATPDVLGQAAVAVIAQGDARVVTLSAAQVNTLLAARFDSAPLAGYAAAPRVDLGAGLITLSARIALSEGASVVPVTLTMDLAIVRGALETRPTNLTPLGAGIAAAAKRGDRLLLTTLWSLAESAAEGRRFFFSEANIRSGQIQFTIILVRG